MLQDLIAIECMDRPRLRFDGNGIDEDDRVQPAEAAGQVETRRAEIFDDETIRVATGIRLGCRLGEPRQCPCGTFVDAKGLHGRAYKRPTGRTSRHNFINDVV